MKFCPQCGTKLDDSTRFCVACGAKQPDVVASAERIDSETVSQPSKKKWDWSWLRWNNLKRFLPIIRAGLITMLALVMLIMAFLPTTYLQPQGSSAVAAFGIDEMKIKVSAVQNVGFLFDSLKQLDDQDLYDSDIAEELGDLSEEMEEVLEDELDRDELEEVDEYDDLPGKARKLFNRMMVLSLRLAMQSEMVAMPPVLIALAIFSFLYLLLSVAAFVLAIFHLLTVLGVFKREICKKPPVGWLFAVPTMLVALQAAMSFAFRMDGTIGVGFTGAGVTVFVLSAIVLVACVAYLLLEKQSPSLRTLLWRIPAVVVAVVLLSTLGGTVFNTHIKTYFAGKSSKSEVRIPYGAGFFNELVLSEPDYEELDEWSEEFFVEEAELEFAESFEDFEYYTKKELERGEANEENVDLLILLAATHGAHDYLGLFGTLPLLYAIVALGACLILWQNAVWLTGGTYRRSIVIAAKVTALIAMLLALTLAIVYLVVHGIFINVYMPDGYHLSIGAGVIASAIFALGAIFCPSRVRSKKLAVQPTPEETVPQAVNEPIAQPAADEEG